MSYLNFLRSDRKREDIPNLFDIYPFMEKKELRIVFMGTPEFAEFTLRRLVEDHYNIVGVVPSSSFRQVGMKCLRGK